MQVSGTQPRPQGRGVRNSSAAAARAATFPDRLVSPLELRCAFATAANRSMSMTS